MVRKVTVVAHTHWDREWYAPFEAFRTRLVETLDTLLPVLDGDPEYRSFLLDGQMAVVDDYLSVRPGAEGAIRRLAADGRLAMGPWYILMDEFCVSGETIVRNLQRGLKRAADFGGAMPVGYLPDMFGHVAQMPQLLRLAGFEQAVVWRGVPAAITRSGFWWEAPDGSAVRAEYLPVGYANGAHLPRDAHEFVRRIRAHADEVAGFLDGDEVPLLLMNGTDHQAPQPWLPELLREANALQGDFRFEQGSLAGHLAAAPADGLPRWHGELRSGARASLLMGVLSNRVDVKTSAARTERLLERLAEPLAALWLPPDQWPGELLDAAWLEVIRNSAHDSICACSADEVGRAVLQRYDAAAALGADVARRSLAIAAVATSESGPVVVNPGPRDASGLVELTVPGTTPPAGAQVIAAWTAAVEERSGLGRDFGTLTARLTLDGWLERNRGTGMTVEATDAGVDIRIEVDLCSPASPLLAATHAEAHAQAGAHRDQPLRIRVERRAGQRVVARVAGVPGYGWKAWRPTPLAVPPVTAGGTCLDNGTLRVEVDPADGTFAIGALRGLDRLVDGGDEGDTYNYSPPATDTLVDRPESVAVECVEEGPVRGRLRVLRRYFWPSAISGGERTGRAPVDVSTELELRAGENLVRVSTSFDNPCRDHRLRVVFPLPERDTRTVAECAFATVERAGAEGSGQEPALATFPSRRFVSAGGLTFTHEGLLEHELVDEGRALAVTLLRATGMLSRPAPAARPVSAGPALPVEGAQMIGPHQVRYAVAVGEVDPWRLADLAWLDLQVVRGTGTGRLPAEGSRLRVRGAEVSALHRVDGGALELRVFNPSDNPATVEVPGHQGWLVDLRGETLGRWDRSFELRPWQVASARVDALTLD